MSVLSIFQRLSLCTKLKCIVIIEAGDKWLVHCSEVVHSLVECPLPEVPLYDETTCWKKEFIREIFHYSEKVYYNRNSDVVCTL